MFFKSKAMKKVISENKKLKGDIEDTELKLSNLVKHKIELNNEIEELKLKRKIEEEDLKHLIKIREERLEIEFEKRKLAEDAKNQEKIHIISNEYKDKVEKFLIENVEKSERMYSELLVRLPDVNVRLKGEV